MRILGIDPGYGLVGFGVIDSESYGKYCAVEYGVISTEKDTKFSDRLLIIYDGMKYLIDKFHPDAVAIEELFFHTNTTTAISVAEARGVIIISAKHCKLPLFEYTPLQIKSALTGNGRAEKAQVQYMVKNILELDKTPKPDDSADALAVAICHLQTNNSIIDNSF